MNTQPMTATSSPLTDIVGLRVSGVFPKDNEPSIRTLREWTKLRRIPYLSGVLAAVGIIASGIAMMMGRHSIAKWAFAGAMVSGLAFAIVRTMWTNFGLTAPEVGAFNP